MCTLHYCIRPVTILNKYMKSHEDYCKYDAFCKNKPPNMICCQFWELMKDGNIDIFERIIRKTITKETDVYMV